MSATDRFTKTSLWVVLGGLLSWSSITFAEETQEPSAGASTVTSAQQNEQPAAEQPPSQSAPAHDEEVLSLPPEQEALAQSLGSLLRCPVCQGMPIGESPATMARNMMRHVRKMVSEGKSKDEIIGYFTQRYGEWVLLQPRASGFTLWVWILPPLLIVAGVIVVARSGRKKERTSPSKPSEGSEVDPYLARVREEVDV